MPSTTSICIQTVAASESAAVGSSYGILLTAHSSTGCIWGASGIKEKGKEPVEVAIATCNALLNSIHSNGCVDEHLQDQVRFDDLRMILHR